MIILISQSSHKTYSLFRDFSRGLLWANSSLIPLTKSLPGLFFPKIYVGVAYVWMAFVRGWGGGGLLLCLRTMYMLIFYFLKFTTKFTPVVCVQNPPK